MPLSSSKDIDLPQRPRSSGSTRPSTSSASTLLPSPSVPERPLSSASVRPGSSVSIRPSTSAPIRPSSSASIHPFSGSHLRPSSSASTVRPLSSASTRPSSRLTQRSISRLSHRPSSRQSSRLLPLCQALVTQVAGLTSGNDEENFRTAVEFVSKNLDQTVRPSASADMHTIDEHFLGHIQKACINSHDTLANALEISYRRLKCYAEENTDLDSEIKMSRLPDHLQLLILLSLPSSQATFAFAEQYVDEINNPPGAPSSLTWKDILAEEPFEGQHWEGVYGLPPGSTVENWEARSGESTPSLSPLDDSDDFDDFLSSPDVLKSAETTSSLPVKANESHLPVFPASYSHREDVENLQARQYWRAEWRTDVVSTRAFNIGDASTLGPTMHRVLGDRATLKIDGPKKQKFIHEPDAVCEVLMGLQGRRNMMLRWVPVGDNASSFEPSPSVRLLHLTATAQMSILGSFAQTATTLEHLRKFVSAVFANASRVSADASADKPPHLRSSRRSTLTLEAFSAAIDTQIRGFDSWCAAKEEEMCVAKSGAGPPLVISLLGVNKAIQDAFSATFDVILDLVRQAVKIALKSPEVVREIWTLPDLPMRISLSSLAALLLDLLLYAVQESISNGDTVTSNTLMRMFGDSAEPIWSMIGRWMKDGMPIRNTILLQGAYRDTNVDDEFFIEDNEMALLDPDFWTDGFTLRDGHLDGRKSHLSSVPIFLTHVATHVLNTGKAVGLLRALDVSSVFDREVEEPWMCNWRSFRTLLDSAADPKASSSILVAVQGQSVTSSTESLSRLIYDELVPHSLFAQEMFVKVLVDDCDLWLHLSAMEDLYLMRRGDAMSHFLDLLFARMDGRQPWNDFHFLNSAFHDVADAGSQKWIDSSLVRLSHRGNRDKFINRTVRAIDGLLIEYAVPFPLTYIFGPRAMQIYSSIFSFVLQIRRAKNVLERILVRTAVTNVTQVGSEMKVFYAMRNKLSWFVNTLLSFVATNVLHAQVLNFHSAFRQATSLDEMIQLHGEHLRKIEGRCLLQRNTSALQRAVTSILDMTLHFSDCFVAFAGDTTHDISRHSILVMKRHRSRRAKRQRKNIIGFSQSLRELDDTSESDSDLDEGLDGANGPGPSFSLAASTISLPEESVSDRLEKMSTELDTLVRFIRRGVESLAAGTSEAASAFGIFAFALEDWDR
ncbi:hypothetical protein AcW2_006240 [Taiwanofungus camphoratus]|nr:hypothetical protein AcW2_006240 [Antrodia cinnamomea]